MQMETSARDVFMRHTDTDGKSFVFCHRVWITEPGSADKFVAIKQDAAAAANAQATKDKKPALASSQQITEAQYLKEKA